MRMGTPRRIGREGDVTCGFPDARIAPSGFAHVGRRTRMGSEDRITLGRDFSTYRCPAGPTRTTSFVRLPV